MPFAIHWRLLRALLWRARPLWQLLAGVLVACLTGYLWARASLSPVALLPGAIRYASMILQLLGLGLVAKGLSDSRRLFGSPSIIRDIRAWLSDLLRAFGKPRSFRMEGSAGGFATASGEGSFRVALGSGASVEERLVFVERAIDRLRSEFESNAAKTRADIGAVKTHILTEVAKLRAADEHAVSQIEEFAVGGLHLETVGLVWLFLATIGGAAPDEAARFLGILYNIFP